MDPPPALDPSKLPPSTSPTLSLEPATPIEKTNCWQINAPSWRGALDTPAYLRREQHLQNQEQNRDGGIVYWILVDTALQEGYNENDASQSTTNGNRDEEHGSVLNGAEPLPRQILASCESLRKKALVLRGGNLKEETVWGIGSVFVREEYRGRGYAGRMMDELGRRLETWGQDDGRKTAFTVLYSDIGKTFYAHHGWHPFPSLHISLPALPPITSSDDPSSLAPTSSLSLPPPPSPLPESYPLTSAALPHLCDLDIASLRNTLSTPPESSTNQLTIALLPTAPTMAWHHARESFFYKHAKPTSHAPYVKGAMCEYLSSPSNPSNGTAENGTKEEEKKKVWLIWTRSWAQKQGEEGILQVLRVGGTEEDHASDVRNTFASGPPTEARGQKNSSPSIQANGVVGGEIVMSEKIKALASVLHAAQLEAYASGLERVEIWNPGPATVEAARLALRLEPGKEVLVEERERCSLPCLGWYGGEGDEGKKGDGGNREGWKDVKWVANEKFGWC